MSDVEQVNKTNAPSLATAGGLGEGPRRRDGVLRGRLPVHVQGGPSAGNDVPGNRLLAIIRRDVPTLGAPT